MIYVEYFSRLPGVALADFHRAVAQGQEGWGSSYQEDRLVWHAGRTWRLGPEPEYVAVWHTPDADFDRIDDWDRIFRGGAAERHERVFRSVQMSWAPDGAGEDSPWMRMFRNARVWVG